TTLDRSNRHQQQLMAVAFERTMMVLCKGEAWHSRSVWDLILVFTAKLAGVTKAQQCGRCRAKRDATPRSPSLSNRRSAAVTPKGCGGPNARIWDPSRLPCVHASKRPRVPTGLLEAT